MKEQNAIINNLKERIETLENQHGFLSKDYEIPGTGVTVPNAYFIVDDIRVEKRMTDFPYPGMDLTDEQRVEKGEPLVNFKAGRVMDFYCGVC